jgi:pimeloyl-ACP methyl ester carboxylesterase
MLTPVEMANRFNKDLNNSTLNILKSVGHVPMEESPDKSLDYVLKFLK